MNDKRNAVIVALVAAALIPRIQKLLGVTLTIDDIAGLMALAVTAGHSVCAVIERYFPPPSRPAQMTTVVLQPKEGPATSPPFVPPNSEKSI
jgi:hypothetical protein